MPADGAVATGGAVAEDHELQQPDRVAADAQIRLPLLDFISIMRVGWAYRRLVLGLIVVGAIGGAGLAMTVPKKYSATAVLYFDPTSIRTTQEGADAGVPAEILKTTVDSQAKIIALDSVIRSVVLKLRLAADPAFAGRGVEDVVGALRKAIKITRPEGTYITEVKVTSNSPAKAAQIANTLVDTFLDQDQQGKLGKYATINSAFGGRLDELRKEVEVAEGAVERFRSENDLVEAEGELIADKRLTALNELLVTTQQATITAKSKLESASHIDVNDVVNGNLKDDQNTTTLGSLRVQYANLSSSLGKLESQLGSRHPSLIAARASIDTLRTEIRNELARQVSSAKDQYDQAAKAEKEVRNELTAQKALRSMSTNESVQLKELERKATAAKELYEAVLKRAGETTEEKNLLQNNVRVVSKATTPLAADAPSRSMLLVAGLFGGAMLGMILGILAALLRNALVAHRPQPREDVVHPTTADLPRRHLDHAVDGTRSAPLKVREARLAS